MTGARAFAIQVVTAAQVGIGTSGVRSKNTCQSSSRVRIRDDVVGMTTSAAGCPTAGALLLRIQLGLEVIAESWVQEH